MGSIEAPLRDTDEVIEFFLDQLPDENKVLGILHQKKAPVNLLVNLVLENYKQGEIGDFIKILKASRNTAFNDQIFKGW